MTLDKIAEILASFADRNYRQHWTSERIDVGLAFQIRALRQSKGWTQVELSKNLGSNDSAIISRWENPNYGSQTLTTLKRLAEVFDVGLVVRFAPFSECAEQLGRLTAEDLAPLSYEAETLRHEAETCVEA